MPPTSPKTAPKPTRVNPAGTGFAAPDAPRHRIVVAIDALEKNGKTHFGLSAPGPVGIMNFDIGLEGVVEKVAGVKQVLRANYDAEPVPGDTQKTADNANAMLAKFLPEFKWALQNFRSVVLDTGSEAWEKLRLARFGKLTQVMPHHYGPVNAEYRKLIRMGFEYDANLIILHKIKAAYETKMVGGKEVSNKIPGAFQRQGMSETGFLVQANCLLWRGDSDDPPVIKGDLYTNVTYDPTGTFNLLIKDSRHNAEAAGTILSGEMCSFPWLAASLMVDTTPEDWE